MKKIFACNKKYAGALACKMVEANLEFRFDYTQGYQSIFWVNDTQAQLIAGRLLEEIVKEKIG